MAKKEIRVLVFMPITNNLLPLRLALQEIAQNLKFAIIFLDHDSRHPRTLMDNKYQEIARSDLIIAEITNPSPSQLIDIGITQAFNKPILLLTQNDRINLNISDFILFMYDLTELGLNDFKKNLINFLNHFIDSPKNFFQSTPTSPNIELPYIIDLTRLNPREFENLCFELITQLGFRRVEWGTQKIKEIDVIATLPKKDPDLYEYNELWFISLGMREISYELLKIATKDPEYILRRILPYALEELYSKYSLRNESPITLLFITAKSFSNSKYIDEEIRYLNRRNRYSTSSFRIRTWDEMYIINLIQRFPQIAYKYFSSESRIRSKTRKSPEELYDENVSLTEELLKVKNQLVEEKKKRFIAERDSAWKDIAFKAAHKLGNPVDAVDTFLQSLKKRIQVNNSSEAIDIANSMDNSIEEAKNVIAQFKFLNKAHEINYKTSDLLMIINQALKFAKERGIITEVLTKKKIPKISIDPQRISECFNELIANSMHWFNKDRKEIHIVIRRITKKELSLFDGLDNTLAYIKINFTDNGAGIPIENKEKIFAPFFTTYTHGTGLGLSMVKTIIEAHGGRILENGVQGEGANFEILLPIKQL